MVLEFKVPSMVCDRCADTVKSAIANLDSSAKVNVTLETKAVTVETNASLAAVQEAIADVGHTVA